MQKVKEKSNWKGETIVEIEIERLKAFRNHPFQVRDDDDLEKLKESIKMYGILTPLLVRPIKDGTYEIISGHRRKRAAALLGYRKIPVLIQPMSYEDAVVKMVDTNLHREHISFSEKAFAYRMKNEAMKQKVGRKKGQSGQQKKGKKTIELIGEEFGDSPKQVQRYIAVTRLIPELLQKLDRGEISFNPAVEISALTKEEQKELLEAMNYAQSTPSVSQAQRIKKLSKAGELTKKHMEDELIVETVAYTGKKLVIASNELPTEFVKNRFMKLNFMHIQYVISSMKKNTTEIKNIKKYLLAALYNAPATMQGYYQAEVNYAMPQYAKRN